MKNENDGLETNNLFFKVKSWLYNIFHKSQISESKSDKTESTSIVLNEQKDNNKPSNFFEDYREKTERRQYLLNLQRKYKNKEILEENMSDEDRIGLENIYAEQNAELKRRIKALDSKIAKVKEVKI